MRTEPAPMTLAGFVRDRAAAAGIPEQLVVSVFARLRASQDAVEGMHRSRPGRFRACPPLRVLVERIVRSAAADHRRGVLEKVVE